MAKKSKSAPLHQDRDEMTHLETRPRSFRISIPVLGRLEKQAQLKDVSANTLAQQFIDEGLRMSAHPQIFFRGGAIGRRPVLVATRLDIWQVIETFRENNDSVEKTAEYLSIPQNRVKAAIRYYEEYPEEIDLFIKHTRELADLHEVLHVETEEERKASHKDDSQGS